MIVRGAPVIGVSAGYGMVLTANAGEYLKSSRPTAVNLMWAADRMVERAEAVAVHEEDKQTNRNKKSRLQKISFLILHSLLFILILLYQVYVLNLRLLHLNDGSLLHRNSAVLIITELNNHGIIGHIDDHTIKTAGC